MIVGPPGSGESTAAMTVGLMTSASKCAQPMMVLLNPAVSHLLETEDALQYPERMFHLRSHSGLHPVLLRNKVRFCDTCDAEITAGESFRTLTLSPNAAAATPVPKAGDTRPSPSPYRMPGAGAGEKSDARRA
jgi:hypothetical protein